MNRRLPITLPLCLAACVLAARAEAAGRSASLAGVSLGIDTPCARQVEIVPDAGLHGEIKVQADADHQEELDRLVTEVTDKVHVRTRPARCWHPDDTDFQPTLSLSIHVPPGTPIAIDEGAMGRYTIGPVGGTLAIDLSGAGELTAADVTALTVDLSGSGNIHVARANGPASVEISGHGQVQIDTATMPHLTAELSGAGMFGVAAGQIGSIKVENSGVANVKIGATVGDAQVEISGAGTVHFATVTGKLDKDVSGIGDVQVGK